MPDRTPRLAGRLRRARIRAAHALIILGGALHGALAELGIRIEPKFGTDADGYRRPRAWPGLVVVAVLLAGVALIAGGTGWTIVQALPQREARP